MKNKYFYGKKMATLKELKELATKEKLKGRSSMNRDQLCQELNKLDKYELDCSPNRRKSSPKKQPKKRRSKGSPKQTSPPKPKKGKEERNLEKFTVKQLKEELKERKIPFKTTLRKAELILLLQQNEKSPPKKSPPKKSPPKTSPIKNFASSPPPLPKPQLLESERKRENLQKLLDKEFSSKWRETPPKKKEKKEGIVEWKNGKMEKEVEEIRQHYNKVNNDRRKEENILALRKFNNFIKKFLIEDAYYDYVVPGKPVLTAEDFMDNDEYPGSNTVLDICCGRGGDMMKWFGVNATEVVFCDISNKSLEEAKRRYDAIKGPKYKAKFLQVDCFSSDVTKALKKIGAPKFDVISCQFAVHYAFSDEQRVNNLFTTIDENLNEGGVFLGTTTNSRWLLERGRKEKKFGNKVFQVEFEHQVTKKEEAKDYGIGYSFSLANAVEDLKEYVVKPQVLKKKGEEVGLELVQIKNFKKYDEELMKRGHYADKHNMKIGTLTPQEKPLLDAYITFIFHRE